jgi:hypothetical protein
MANRAFARPLDAAAYGRDRLMRVKAVIASKVMRARRRKSLHSTAINAALPEHHHLDTHASIVRHCSKSH